MPARIEALPLSTLLTRLDAGARDRPRPGAADDVADSVRFVLQRARIPVRNTCLVRCLTVYGILRQEGLGPQIVFAIKPGQRIEEGHCWLELDGAPYLEPDERRLGFVPVFRHPEPETAA